jgi:hypothetical protein
MQNQEISTQDLFLTVETMHKYGGNFYKKIADALLAADPENRKKLLSCFPKILQDYGPESKFNSVSW